MELKELIDFRPRQLTRLRTTPDVFLGASLPNYAKVGRFVMLFGCKAIPQKNWLVVEAPTDDESPDPIYRHLLVGSFEWKFSDRASDRASTAMEKFHHYTPPVGADHSLWVRNTGRYGLQIHTIWSYSNLNTVWNPATDATTINPVPAPGAVCVTTMAGASRGCAFVSRLCAWDGNSFNDPEALAKSPMTPLMWPRPQKYWIRPSEIHKYI